MTTIKMQESEGIAPMTIGYFESELPDTNATCFYFSHMDDVYVIIESEGNTIKGYYNRKDWVKLQEAMILTLVDVQ